MSLRVIMFEWLKKLSINFKFRPQTTNTLNAGDKSSEVELSEECKTHKKNGDICLNRGEFEKASASYQQAIACNPNYAEAYNNLSIVCREINQLKDAEYYLKLAIKVNPALANAYYNLASLILDQGRLSEALENFAKTVELEPTHYAAQAFMLTLQQKLCIWSSSLDSDIRILREAASATTTSNISIFSPFSFLALPSSTAEEQKHCAKKWVQYEYQHFTEMCNQLGFKFKQSHNGKIHIGYLSADFHDHATSRLIAQVFELHDRSQFHITAYSYGPDDGSEMRKRLKNTFDQFADIQAISDVEAARLINSHQIDILIDLKGFTKDSRSGILAMRPAPIQVNYLGYPGTMGAEFINYLIADQFIIPREQFNNYSEDIYWLPDCYQPNDRSRPRLPAPTRKECGLPNDGFVFCCFNQTYKITPELFDVWCQLLKVVPESVLWLLVTTPQAENNLKQESIRRGIDPERLIMAPMLAEGRHLARLQCADLFLDTIPVNAHTTCSDALWMGLPVITCSGETFPSRVAGSLLSAMRVPELVTCNLEEYFNLALDLSTHRKKLDAIRDKIIANRDNAPLFDTVRFTRNLETVYLKMKADHFDKIDKQS